MVHQDLCAVEILWLCQTSWTWRDPTALNVRHHMPRDAMEHTPGGRRKRAAAGSDVRLTAERLTRAARAHVATAARRTACLYVSRAMQAARRRSDFDFTRQLGCRAEAGPRQVLARVGRRGSLYG